MPTTRKPAAKKVAETTATKEESPAVSEPRDEGFLVCTALGGSVQIHLVKDASEDTFEEARDDDKPRVAEVRSRILKLGEYVLADEADERLVEAVKAGEVEHLQYAGDEKDLKLLTYEAQSQEELVSPSRVFYSAEKQMKAGQFQGPLVGAAAQS